jgi:hypothetical protein
MNFHEKSVLHFPQTAFSLLLLAPIYLLDGFLFCLSADSALRFTRRAKKSFLFGKFYLQVSP